MTPREARFVAEYILTLKPVESAMKAGYSTLMARRNTGAILARPTVAAAIARRQEAYRDVMDIKTEHVLEALRSIAFADVRMLFDESNQLRPLTALTAAQAACIASFEVIKRSIPVRDGLSDTVIKVLMANKLKALELLGKHLALFIDRSEVKMVTDVRHLSTDELANEARALADRLQRRAH